MWCRRFHTKLLTLVLCVINKTSHILSHKAVDVWMSCVVLTSHEAFDVDVMCAAEGFAQSCLVLYVINKTTKLLVRVLYVVRNASPKDVNVQMLHVVCCMW